MDKFLEKYNLPYLSEEEAESLNRPITPDANERIIKKLPTHQSPGPGSFTSQCYKTIKEELTPTHLRLFKKNPRSGNTPKLFTKPALS